MKRDTYVFQERHEGQRPHDRAHAADDVLAWRDVPACGPDAVEDVERRRADVRVYHSYIPHHISTSVSHYRERGEWRDAPRVWKLSTSSPLSGQAADLLGGWDLAGQEKPEETYKIDC